MKLDRQELLKAIDFTKHAVVIDDQPSPRDYFHIKIFGDRCQITTTNKYFGKRVTLFRPQQLSFEETEIPDPDQEFMIDKPIMMTYEQLLKEHKAAFKKAAKTDITLNHIDISSSVLESHKDAIPYNQPLVSYPDVDKYFVEGNLDISQVRFESKIASDALKEFPGRVDISFDENPKSPGNCSRIYLQIESGFYQAFFMTVGRS